MPLPYVTPNQVKSLEKQVEGKQDTLESGVNIKTINNQSILGTGNINVSGGTEVVANPGLTGNERQLSSLKIGETVYDLKGKTFEEDDTYSESSVEYQANRNRATTDIYNEFSNDECRTTVETEITTVNGYAGKLTTVQFLDTEDNPIASAQISMETGVDAETGDAYSKIDIKGDDELGTVINIGGEFDQVNINGESYSPGGSDSTLEFDTVTDLYSYLTSNNISYCPIMISNIGNVERFTRLGVLDSSTPQVIGIDDITDILTYFGNEARIYQKTFNTKSHLCIVIGETMEF